jgi:hypothetical protein
LGDSVNAPLEIIVTVAVATLLVPPAPVQANEYDVVAVRGPVFWLPPAASAPLQPPEAVQEVALDELHVSVETPPTATTGRFATNVAVGTTLTVTVDTELAPPAPVHVKEYELGNVRAPVFRVPLVGWGPLQLPEAAQEVALVEVHVSVEAPPLVTEVGAAIRDALAGKSVLEGLAPPAPPPPHAATSSDALMGTKRLRNL